MTKPDDKSRPVPADRVRAILQGELAKADDRIMILAPIVRGRKGEYRVELEKFARDGFVRARIDGDLCPLDWLKGLALWSGLPNGTATATSKPRPIMARPGSSPASTAQSSLDRADRAGRSARDRGRVGLGLARRQCG